MKHKRILLGLAVIFLVLARSVAGAGEPGRNLALCVGIDSYEHLAELHGPVNDAINCGKLLEESGDFRKVIVLTEIDESYAEVKPRFMPTKKNILNSLKLLANNAASADGLMFMFSGHGMKLESENYLMAMDSDGEAETGISLTEIMEIMGKSKAQRKVLFLDASRDNEMFPGLTGEIQLPSDDFAAVVSCADHQVSIVDEDTGRGIFFLGFENAVGGEADTDEDGSFSMSEIAEYLELFMGEYCLDNLIVDGQTPVDNRTGDEDFVLLNGYAFLSQAVHLKSAEQIRAEEETKKKAEETRRKAEAEIAAKAKAAQARIEAREKAEEENRKAEAALVQAEQARAGDSSGSAASSSHAASNTIQQPLAKDVQDALDAADKERAEGKMASSFSLYLGLANTGVAEAQYQVGDSYYFGKGVSEDKGRAVEWLRKAGLQGHPKAREMLASMYYFGNGVPQDLAEAAKWSSEAAYDSESGGFKLVLLNESGARQVGDLGPALRLEILRPEQAAITIGEMFTDCDCLAFAPEKHEYSEGERAFLNLRVVKVIPEKDKEYDVYVELKAPIQQTLRMTVAVSSDYSSAAQPAQVQQTYQQQPQYYQQQRQYQQQPSQGSSGNPVMRYFFGRPMPQEKRRR